MGVAVFYHLTQSTVAQTAAVILPRALAADWRVMLRGTETGALESLDMALWQGDDSLVLLEQVGAVVAERGWSVVNIDSVIVAERPRLKPHIGAMGAAIAARMGLSADQVGKQVVIVETVAVAAEVFKL